MPLTKQSEKADPVDIMKTMHDPASDELRRVEVDVVIPKM
jgi:hypothetical protein